MTIKTLPRRFVVGTAFATAVQLAVLASPVFAETGEKVIRASVPSGAIEHVLVIDLENENYSVTFGSVSPAVYLNTTLLQQGELIPNYFGTSHVSLGNYVAQVSGQGTNPTLNNDCLDLTTLRASLTLGTFTDVLPGTDSLDQVAFPGQVVGTGCVMR